MPQSSIGSLVLTAAPWGADWIWGCPLIVLTVILHVLGLGVAGRAAVKSLATLRHRNHPAVAGAVILAGTTLLATALHGFEAGLWALAYRLIGAMPNFKTSMLYSLGAMTTFGQADLSLPTNWGILGAIEALNGWLLFGLSGAFLFWLIQSLASVGPLPLQPERPRPEPD